ncbi:Leu/Phe/Val dehydrogenase [Legionella longbeachae]|uniref:Putative leucine dehydrogenase n=1 Tax=Legionella longbeachae serogroup 1 (strain NSW150) TaxID=661367 RepID=D3HPX4_LEGLN|nr:amino acid dehydrogenase [Legionella longbeachae]VEE01459.1 leucine dehydrogenase [Legionella oakridgensis]HBD7396177.1 amino acid dehydrogenase [Legionella pneumophila]ARB92181.1 amino acid dehydrogenase [Legionella longbeachae]ARM34639.1 amino acid dehydrogenase [Legionella longbeachae]QIN31398.1 amino acid dehydrogenase [Legionella longbeachae]
MMSVDNISNSNQTIADDDFLDYALSHGFGDLHFKVDPETGMKAIIAIHNTKLGPALGGCRFIEYPNTQAAVKDAMRLARGMSFKAASVNLPLGGGKSVIIKPRESFDRAQYMHQFGKFVHELNGRYITALDSGTELKDMDIIAEHTPYVASLSKYDGDPSPSTARGILRGIQAAVAFKLGKDSLNGIHVAVQGLGHVGFLLCKHLHELGAKLTVADVSPAAVERAVTQFGAKTVSTEQIHKVPCDVFAPCALGAVINDLTLPQLQTTIIAGAANNQLAHTYHGKKLHDNSILFAVDYVINAGGLIFAASKYLHTPEEQINEQIDAIYTHLMEIFTRSAKENLPTNEIADNLAQEKLS